MSYTICKHGNEVSVGVPTTNFIRCKRCDDEMDAATTRAAPPEKPTRQLVVIESPYAQDPVKMATYLRVCLRDTLHRGESAIASVATYAITGTLNDLDADQRAEGIAAGLEWYRVPGIKCVVYSDHGISRGMMAGMARAQEHGVPIEVRELYPTQGAR